VGKAYYERKKTAQRQITESKKKAAGSVDKKTAKALEGYGY
jgi:hypothetical protein